MSEEMHHRPLRFELKYQIPLVHGLELFDKIKINCEPDVYGDPEHGYEVASTYYDTQDLRFHLDRQESTGYRRKIRLRSYTAKNALNNKNHCIGLFLEIKEKHKHRVGKKRCKLNSLDVLHNEENHSQIQIPFLIPYLSENHIASREVLYLHTLLGLKPTTLIRYIRKSLTGKYDKGLRITLDHRITTGGTSLIDFNNTCEQFIIPPTMAVLEIKSFGSIPLWLQQTLLTFGFSRTRMSKYSEGIETNNRNEHLKPSVSTSLLPTIHNEDLQNSVGNL
jgi:hypothetical protein